MLREKREGSDNNMNKKVLFLYKKLEGQYTLYALFMTIITVIAYLVAGYPILKAVIAEAVVDMDPTLASIIEFTPLLIFLFIIWGAMWYVAPRYEQPPQ